MQWNQPPGNPYGFQSYPKTVLTNPQIIGEGDVAAVTFPDGSVQFYFVPTIKHQLPPYYCNKLPSSNQPCEVWFIRSIIHPQTNHISAPPAYFNNQLPSLFGECLPSAPNFCVNLPTFPEYFQKFHNDASTSTTDIHYFYPSLRRERYIQYCTETQTDLDLQNVCNKPCNCIANSRLREKMSVEIECACHPAHTDSSVSCMSVDSVRSETKRKKRKINRRSSTKNKKILKRNHICECKFDIKETTDKFVTTFTDQASGNTQKNGRQTQTNKYKSKKGDIRTEIWTPMNPKSKCESCCHSESCTCTSDTDADGG